MEKFKFRSEHFYNLLKTQNYKCYLTNRELRPENTNAEHIKPLRAGGKHEAKNICLVDEIVSKLKRYYTVEQIIEVAADIIETRGKEYGFRITKKKI